MNTVNITDENFINSESYKNFINKNTGHGYLKIRASSANEAVPISNVDIIVSNIIDNNKVIFFEGKTDDSGMINGIELPTPPTNPDILLAPNAITYEIEVIYKPSGIDRIYKVIMYPNVCVVQNINIIPDLKVSNLEGELNGS